MNKINKIFCFAFISASSLMVNASSTFSYSNASGTYAMQVFSDNKKLLQAVIGYGSSIPGQSGFMASATLSGSFVFDASNNISTSSTSLGAVYVGAVSDFDLTILDENDDFLSDAWLSVGGAIAGNQTVNGQDLLSLGGNQSTSTNWSGFSQCKTISGVQDCYTLKSISVNFLGDSFIDVSQALPSGLPPAGYAETANRNLALSLTFSDQNQVEHTMAAMITVACASNDGCPALQQSVIDPSVLDSDNDGCMDNVDVFPANSTECRDTDNDGVGNNADIDDDGDGLNDADELIRKTDPLKADSDDDGIVDGNDGFPLMLSTSYVSSQGSLVETLSIKGCVKSGRGSLSKMSYSGAMFSWDLGEQWLTGVAGASGKKIGMVLDGDSIQNLLSTLRAWVPGCAINAVTGQKIVLSLNKPKTQGKLDAKITVDASVAVKGKIKKVKGTYTIKGAIPWTP